MIRAECECKLLMCRGHTSKHFAVDSSIVKLMLKSDFSFYHHLPNPFTSL